MTEPMEDWIEALADQDLTVVPIRGRLARAYRQICYGRSQRARDSRSARRGCRRAVRVALKGGSRLEWHAWTAWDVC